MKPIPLHYIAVALAAVALGLLPGCNPDQGQKPAGSVPSPHFDKVNAHLDLGGDFFCYVDIDGDVQKLIGFLTDLVGTVEKMEDLEFSASDFKGMAEDLGFQRVVAGGASSIDLGDGRYRNSFYLHIPEGRSGFMNLLGGKAAPLAVLELAPEGSDLALERELDLEETMNLVERMVGRIGKDKGRAAFRMAISEMFEEAPVAYEDILPLLHTRVMAVVKFDPAKRLKPDGERGPDLPMTDFLISLDKMGPLLAKMVAKGGERPKQMLQDKDGMEVIQMPIPPAPGDMAVYKPVIAHHKESGRLMLASRGEFLNACVKDGKKLGGDKAFKDAAAGLPDEGNGMVYLSNRVFKEVSGLIGQVMEKEAKSDPEAKLAFSLMTQWFRLGDSPIVVVQANLPEGVLVKANAPFSLKRGVLLQPVTVAAVMAAFSVPAVVQVKSKAKTTRDISNLRQLTMALKVHAVDNQGVYPKVLEELIEKGVLEGETLLFWEDPGSGQLIPWMYMEGVNDSSPMNAIVLASPRPYSNGKRAVAFNDGSVQMIPEGRFQMMLANQKAAARATAPEPDPGAGPPDSAADPRAPAPDSEPDPAAPAPDSATDPAAPAPDSASDPAVTAEPR